FVAGFNPNRSQCEDQSIGTRCDADSVPHTAERRDFLFQRLALLAQHKLLRCQYTVDRFANFVTNRGILSGKIHLRYGLQPRNRLFCGTHCGSQSVYVKGSDAVAATACVVAEFTRPGSLNGPGGKASPEFPSSLSSADLESTGKLQRPSDRTACQST